jgi:hypothetical protein
MRHPYTQILCWMLAIMLATSNLAAQNERPTSTSIQDSSIQVTSATTRANGYWASIGVAPGLNYALLIRTSVSAAFGHNLIVLRYADGGTSGPGGLFLQTEIGAMYGWIGREDLTFASVAAGLAYAKGGTFYRIGGPGGTYGRDYVGDGIGFIAEANAGLKFYFFGLSVGGLFHISPVGMYLCATLNLHVGWIP